jgi:hypothetical protein
MEKTKQNTIWVNTRNEDLKIGDVIKFWYESRRRITNIIPYPENPTWTAPLKDIIFATCEFDIGIGMSLEKDGHTEVLKIT